MAAEAVAAGKPVGMSLTREFSIRHLATFHQLDFLHFFTGDSDQPQDEYVLILINEI